MNKTTKHVYFGSLPIGVEFLHKNKTYIKVDEEYAGEIETAKVWVMEPHYGAIISEDQFCQYDLKEEDVYI